MGNSIEVRNSLGTEVDMMDHGISCCVYVETLAKKYKPSFQMFTFPGGGNDTINERLEAAFKKASSHDRLVSYIFMNDKCELTEDDLSTLEKAIAVFPKSFNQKPLAILKRYRDLLEEHGTIILELI